MCATYLQNSLPTKITMKTPYKLWQTKSQPFEGWLVGCKAFTYINKHGRMKFDTRAAEGTFVAYDLRCTGYWINIGTGKVISQSVKFFEDDFQSQ